MAGKINSSAVINELQRSMALKESGAEGSSNFGKRHAGCNDHGCQPPVAITDTVTLKQHDTITIVKDRLKVQLIKVNDTITINAECASDTIVQTINVPYEKIVYVEKENLFDKIQKLALYFVLVFIGFKVIQRLIDKYLNNG